MLLLSLSIPYLCRIYFASLLASYQASRSRRQSGQQTSFDWFHFHKSKTALIFNPIF